MLILGRRKFMSGSPPKNSDRPLALRTSARPRASSQEFCQGVEGEKPGKNCRKTAPELDIYRHFCAPGTRRLQQCFVSSTNLLVTARCHPSYAQDRPDSA